MAVDKSKLEEIQSGLDFEKSKYSLTFKTSKGDIEVEFFLVLAPGHCKNMLGLAKLGFYDNLIFHRVISGFMIQGGCPEGSGMGGPGYNVDAEFSDKPHDLGVLSMARAQDPNSAGSQFFLCLENARFLDGQYTVFGKANEAGQKVIQEIGAVETGAQDRPNEDVKINEAVVTETSL